MGAVVPLRKEVTQPSLLRRRPTASLHVRRLKRGTLSTHPILGDELRDLRRLQREQDPKSPYVSTSERGTPFSTAGFAHDD